MSLEDSNVKFEAETRIAVQRRGKVCCGELTDDGYLRLGLFAVPCVERDHFAANNAKNGKT
jgi:hypothetical protein